MDKPPILTKEQRKKIKDDWFASLPRGDGKLPRDLELEKQRDADAEYYEGKLEQARAEVAIQIEGMSTERLNYYYIPLEFIETLQSGTMPKEKEDEPEDKG